MNNLTYAKPHFIEMGLYFLASNQRGLVKKLPNSVEIALIDAIDSVTSPHLIITPKDSNRSIEWSLSQTGAEVSIGS